MQNFSFQDYVKVIIQLKIALLTEKKFWLKKFSRKFFLANFFLVKFFSRPNFWVIFFFAQFIFGNFSFRNSSGDISLLSEQFFSVKKKLEPNFFWRNFCMLDFFGEIYPFFLLGEKFGFGKKIFLA